MAIGFLKPGHRIPRAFLLTVKHNDATIPNCANPRLRWRSRMKCWRKSQMIALLVLAIFPLPLPAFAQATKAGIATTIEGNVTAMRVVAPQPVPLKFRDDVFLQDRVVTGDQSFARLLLGGKAVVSIRERSAVTITEVPGRSTVEIESGKIALSVARDRMSPGEVINIKTPNAVAGVRGTVVIAEVSYRSGPGGSSVPVTRLWVIRGLVDTVHTSVSGALLSPPGPLSARESFNADPTTSTKGTFAPEEVGTIVQGLQPQRLPEPDDASQSPARLQAVNATLALLGTPVGSPGGIPVGPLTTPVPDVRPDQTVTSAPITPLTSAGVIATNSTSARPPMGPPMISPPQQPPPQQPPSDKCPHERLDPRRR
jgi:FecR-like protein